MRPGPTHFHSNIGFFEFFLPKLGWFVILTWGSGVARLVNPEVSIGHALRDDRRLDSFSISSSAVSFDDLSILQLIFVCQEKDHFGTSVFYVPSMMGQLYSFNLM